MSPQNRIKAIHETAREQGLAGVILFYSRDVFYFTGTAQPACLVVLPSDYFLFVQSGIEFARRESWLPEEKIIPERSLEAVCRRMFPGAGPGENVGTELDRLTVNKARSLSRALGSRELVDFSDAVLAQRMVKSPEEIENIQAACAAAHAGHEAAASRLSAGMTELELAAVVENAQRLAGHDGIFFMRQPDFFMGRGPLASGPNLRQISGLVYTISGIGLSPAVAAGPSRRVIQAGDLVMIDIPPCVRGYHADQSRMYCIGPPPDEALSLYDRLRDTADTLIKNLAPGLTTGQAFNLARKRAHELDLADSFLHFPSGDQAHFVGHGLGLELNEPPLLAQNGEQVLKAGMTLALELHLMEPEGHTLKLEDTVLINDSGCRVLNLSPREITAV